MDPVTQIRDEIKRRIKELEKETKARIKGKYGHDDNWAQTHDEEMALTKLLIWINRQFPPKGGK